MKIALVVCVLFFIAITSGQEPVYGQDPERTEKDDKKNKHVADDGTESENQRLQEIIEAAAGGEKNDDMDEDVTPEERQALKTIIEAATGNSEQNDDMADDATLEENQAFHSNVKTAAIGENNNDKADHAIIDFENHDQKNVPMMADDRDFFRLNTIHWGRRRRGRKTSYNGSWPAHILRNNARRHRYLYHRGSVSRYLSNYRRRCGNK